MTKEEIFKNFIEDPLLVEKNYISPERISEIKFADPSRNKLIEVIRISINSKIDGESEAVISRKINQYLNK
jgi:hypothetical protein